MMSEHAYIIAQGVNNATDEDGEFWWYQSCTEQPMPFARDGGAPSCCTLCCCSCLSSLSMHATAVLRKGIERSTVSSCAALSIGATIS
jgi:hypothetical protein